MVNGYIGEMLMNYEVICAVCETGNLTKAAKKLNYSQSAVSQAIQSFEKSLGVTLFERSKTGVKPLPGVMPIMESLKVIAEEEKKIQMFADSIRELDHGVVRAGCIIQIATRWLLEIFKEFEEEFPNIRYEVINGTLYELQTNMEEEAVDFGFMSAFAAKGFEFTPLIKDEMKLVLPKGHRLAEFDMVNKQELTKENIILTTEGMDFEIGDILKSVGIREGSVKYKLNDDMVAMKLAELGYGICILPKSWLDISGGIFDVEIRSFSPKCYRTLGVAYPNKEYMTPATTKFIDYMIKWFKQKEGKMGINLYKK